MSLDLNHRYFVINKTTSIMHIHGLCQHTKPRDIAIRLFESAEQVSAFVNKPLRLCKACQKALTETRF